jgi:hypothetical protein
MSLDRRIFPQAALLPRPPGGCPDKALAQCANFRTRKILGAVHKRWIVAGASHLAGGPYGRRKPFTQAQDVRNRVRQIIEMTNDSIRPQLVDRGFRVTEIDRDDGHAPARAVAMSVPESPTMAAL